MIGRGFAFAVTLAVSVTVLQTPPTFTARKAGVRLDVSVLNGRLPVQGLQAQDFEVSDNNVKQQFFVVETLDAPLDLVLLIQPLRSLDEGRQSLLRAGMTVFPKVLRDTDRLAVIMASAAPDVVRPLLNVTRDFAQAPTLTGAEGVALRDGLMRSFLLFDQEDRRKAIFTFTDGQHDRSWVTTAGIEAAAARQPAQVLVAALDTISVGAVGSAVRGPQGVVNSVTQYGKDDAELILPDYLVSLSRKTGGQVVDLRRAQANLVLEEVLTNLRSRYVITYEPSTALKGWHDVVVRLKKRRGEVITRAGYWTEGGLERK